MQGEVENIQDGLDRTGSKLKKSDTGSRNFGLDGIPYRSSGSGQTITRLYGSLKNLKCSMQLSVNNFMSFLLIKLLTFQG